MDKETTPSTLEFVSDQDFLNVYANHVQFETSAWDLKLRFGQLDQRQGQNTIIEHVAVTVPWMQVKLMAYLLQVNLAVHEHLNGRVSVPAGIVPSEDHIRKGSTAFKNSEVITKKMLELYQAFVEANPDAAGGEYGAEPRKPKKNENG